MKEGGRRERFPVLPTPALSLHIWWRRACRLESLLVAQRSQSLTSSRARSAGGKPARTFSPGHLRDISGGAC